MSDLVDRHCPREIGEPCLACKREESDFDDDTPWYGPCELVVMTDRIAALEAERDRLREALRRIRDRENFPLSLLAQVNQMRELARRALQEDSDV